MAKASFVLAILLCIILTGCISDLATPYMQGEAAGRATNTHSRQKEIAYDINYFIQTGDYRALCHAAMLGSNDASNRLQQDEVTCQTYEQNGQRLIRAVQAQVQYLEVTLIEGRTKKADILKAFGNPDDFDSHSLDYDYRNRSPLKGAKISYRQKDGTVFGVVLQKGTDKKRAVFYLDDNGILRDVSWF